MGVGVQEREQGPAFLEPPLAHSSSAQSRHVARTARVHSALCKRLLTSWVRSLAGLREARPRKGQCS